MRIAIVGAGAIGCLFGIRFHKSGHSVLLVHNDRHTVASIRRRGAVLREVSGKTLRAKVDVKQSLTKNDKVDLILLTVKAYDTESVARRLWKTIDGRTPILTLQNGLGNVETIRRYFRRQNLLVGTTTEAAQTNGPGTVSHTGNGLTWIGDLDEKLTERRRLIVGIFRRAGFRTIASENIVGVVWSKAIVNSAINPISALTRIPNGEISRSLELRNAALALVREGISVAKAYGISPKPPPTSMLIGVLASSRKNRSSMLRDIEAARRTEIQQLNGTIASLGRQLGVSVPLNTMMSELVLGLSSQAHL